MYDYQSQRIRAYYEEFRWGRQVNLFTALWVMELGVGFDPSSLRSLLLRPESPMQLDKNYKQSKGHPPDLLEIVPQLMAIASRYKAIDLFKLVPNSKGNYVTYESTEKGRTLFYKALESRIEIAMQMPDADPSAICDALNQRFLSEQRRKVTLFSHEQKSEYTNTSPAIKLLQTGWFKPESLSKVLDPVSLLTASETDLVVY